MTTILFGSGATAPFFNPKLTTDYLTKQILDYNKWEAVVKEYRSRTSKSIATPTKILETIWAFYGSLKNYGKDRNFEVLAELIDKIASFGFDNIPGNNIMNTLLAYMVKQYEYDFGPEWMDVPFLFREIIVQSILELERNFKVDNYDELCGKQHDFLNWIAKTDKKVSLVSLNYDNVLFDSIKGLGFNHCFDYAPQAGNMDSFDYYQFRENDKVVYFPHGHSRFKRNCFDAIQYYTDPEEAERERWAGVGDNTVNSSLTLTDSLFAYNFNTFITTGQTKDAALNLSPYDAYYQRLSKDLLDSDWVYIIGYSFGDEHINRLLHSYLYSNPSGHLLIVDIMKNDVRIIDDVINNNGILRKIYDNFRPSVFMPNIPDYSEFEFVRGWDINNQGYGPLWNYNICFYKKGIIDYLSEYKDVDF